MLFCRFLRSTPTQPLTAAGALLVAFFLLHAGSDARPPAAGGSRSVLDAPQCDSAERVDQALKAGLPLAMDADAGAGLRDNFFERIRPIMEHALEQGNSGDWPLITLVVGFQSDDAASHAAVWKLLDDYQAWLCTAVRAADTSEATPMRAGPLLVLTRDSDSRQRDFHDIVPSGGTLRIFGAVRTNGADASIDPRRLISSGATNYLRWCTSAWSVVERADRQHTREWDDRGRRRLDALVKYAHKNGLWIRFEALNAADFGALDGARQRWQAALEARVDYIGSEQYEELAKARALFNSRPSLLSRPGSI